MVPYRLYICFISSLVIFPPNSKALPVDDKYICIIFLIQVGYKAFCYITKDPNISLAYKTKCIFPCATCLAKFSKGCLLIIIKGPLLMET